MKSNVTNRFAVTPSVGIPRSVFDLSHSHKTTINADYLYPIYVDEVLPGDTFNVNMTGFARLNTPVFPIMDNQYMETFFFEIPMRLVWTNFRKFMGERYPNPDSTIDYTVPQAVSLEASDSVGLLSDYMGLPIEVDGLSYSNLWHRAYYLIWNEYFRDQNLQNSLTVDLDDGPDVATDYVLQKVCKKHDYFTSCLPWPQKGSTAVSLPLGTVAPVVGNNADIKFYGASEQVNRTLQVNGVAQAPDDQLLRLTSFAGANIESLRFSATQTGLQTDLTNATAATINQLRQAFQTQKLLERDARGGTRYIEIIRSHFAVNSPDGSAWRPLYLGGGRSFVNIHAIAQTSSTDAVTPQGNLAAMGTAVLDNHGFTKSFTEHSLILGLVCIRADLTYSQGIARKFTRSTRYDFYWPALAQIGEQAVLQKELYIPQGTAVPATDNAVFGYQERHAEYRFTPSRLSGLMRPGAAGTLAAWHLSELLAPTPALNAAFIVSNTPMARVTAVDTQPDFLLDMWFNIKAARPMPLYGIPGNLDRF